MATGWICDEEFDRNVSCKVVLFVDILGRALISAGTNSAGAKNKHTIYHVRSLSLFFFLRFDKYRNKLCGNKSGV